jgi:Flp pilus assembly protein TadB
MTATVVIVVQLTLYLQSLDLGRQFASMIRSQGLRTEMAFHIIDISILGCIVAIVNVIVIVHVAIVIVLVLVLATSMTFARQNCKFARQDNRIDLGSGSCFEMKALRRGG